MSRDTALSDCSFHAASPRIRHNTQGSKTSTTAELASFILWRPNNPSWKALRDCSHRSLCDDELPFAFPTAKFVKFICFYCMTRRPRAVPHPCITLRSSIHTLTISPNPHNPLEIDLQRSFVTTMGVIGILYANLLLGIADVSARLFAPPPGNIGASTSQDYGISTALKRRERSESLV